MSEAEFIYRLNQHIGWLMIYAANMTPENWRDERENIETQLELLSEHADKFAAGRVPSPPTGPPHERDHDHN